VRGDGEDKVAALTDLAQLRELRDAERQTALEEKFRAAYLHGAEEHSRANAGTTAHSGRT
jgi:hypothetical protein